MENKLKKILLWLGLGLVVLLGLVVVNQLVQIHGVVSAVHPTLGRVVTIILTVLFTVLFSLPVFGYLGLRKPLDLPEQETGPEYERYLKRLQIRLSKNKHLRETGFAFDKEKPLRPQIDEALQKLNEKAEKSIAQASSTVFLTTAISQNGALDGLFVLGTLSRLVWQISHIYNQRPKTKEIAVLYFNVIATVLLSREIEDLAFLDEQLEPVIDSLIGGSLSQLIPGTTAVTTLIVGSVIEGSANAFLTLRVGSMARRYSAAVIKADRRVLRRSATVDTCRLLGSVVRENSVAVVRAFASASKKATIDRTLGTIRGGAVKTGSYVKDMFTR